MYSHITISPILTVKIAILIIIFIIRAIKNYLREENWRMRFREEVIGTNPEPTDDSIPFRMLRWTNYEVYIALIALVIGDCSLFCRNGSALEMKLFGLIISTGAIVALNYRFLTWFYEKYSSDTSLFNNSLHVVSKIFFIAMPIMSMLISCVSAFLTYDHNSILPHYDAIIFFDKLDLVLTVAIWGFAAYYGYYLRSGFDGKLKKLGLSVMIFGALAAILGICSLFTESNPYELYEGAMRFKSEDILTITLIVFAYWVAMWPFRIMTKILVNGETAPDSSSTRNLWNYQRDINWRRRFGEEVIDTNPEAADDSIPNRMLRWTDYAVYIALIALVIGECSPFFSSGLALVMNLFGLIISTGAIVALVYRFLIGFYEKYSSDTSLFNNSLYDASHIFFIAIPIVLMLVSCVSAFLTYDRNSIFSHYDDIIFIIKLDSVLNVAIWGFAAYYGYYLRSRFDGKLKKLGLSLMIFGALAAILGIFVLFTELNPYELYEGASNEDILTITLMAFAYWVAMWPFRIMTKLLVNGETDPDSSSTRNI